MNNIKKYLLYPLLYVVLLAPFVITSSFTMFSADDYSLAVEIMPYKKESSLYLVALIRFVIDRWFEWSGRWVTSLFPLGINPLIISKNPYTLLSILMPIFFCAFMIAIGFALKVVLETFFRLDNSKMSSAIIFVFLATLLNTDIYPEIFYWFTGANYTVMLIHELLAIAFSIMYFEHENGNRYTVPYALFGFFACNNLQAIVPLFLIVLWYEYKRYKNKTVQRRDVIIILLFVVAVLLNVLAPGNYVRHDVIDSSGLHPIWALWYVLVVTMRVAKEMVRNSIVIAFSLGLIMLGIVTKYRGFSVGKRLYKLIAFSALSLIGVIYPLTLGYSSAENLANRNLFVIKLHCLIILVVVLFPLGNELIGKALLENRVKLKNVLLCFVLALSMSGLLLIRQMPSLPYYVTINSLDDTRKTNAKWLDIINQIASSEENDVEICAEDIPAVGMLKVPGITKDKEDWVNEAVATYYGKNSVAIVDEIEE